MNDLAASTKVSSLGLLFRRKRREMNPRQKKIHSGPERSMKNSRGLIFL